MVPVATPRSRFRRSLSFLLVLAIPPAALAVWFAVQDPNSLVAPKSWSNARALIFDEFDLTAMALRGLNADRGRLAGRMTPPGESQTGTNWRVPLPTDPVDEPPLEPRYFLEYPHAALLFFRAGYWIQPAERDLA